MPPSPGLLDPLFGTAEADALFDGRARLQAMLDVEAALARAEAAAGVIPGTAPAAVAAAARAELFDAEALAREAAAAGNLAIPLVRALTARVRESDPEAARFVHWGATSQDVIDTAMVLQLRRFLDLLEVDAAGLAAALAALAERHRTTVMLGRTWLQQALPVTFGLKAAGWLDALARSRERLAELRPRLLVLQFGGAAGTLAALGKDGPAVAAALAQELDLALPALPWHGARDRIAELGTALGLLVGCLGKIARDLSLLMQSEVAEAFEPAAPGKGASSTMPQKRNPVACAVVLAAATRAPGLVATLLAALPQEHERGLGGWHAEWETLPELCRLTAGALARTRETLEGLELNPGRMRANFELTRGLVMAEAVQTALAERLGRLPAHDLVEAACRRALAEGRHLREVLAEEEAVTAALNPTRLDALFDPLGYLGATENFIEAVLARYRSSPSS